VKLHCAATVTGVREGDAEDEPVPDADAEGDRVPEAVPEGEPVLDAEAVDEAVLEEVPEELSEALALRLRVVDVLEVELCRQMGEGAEHGRAELILRPGT